MTRRRRTPPSAATRQAAARWGTGGVSSRIWPFGLLLLALGAAAFANSLSNPFVFDDVGSVVENTTIHQILPLSRSLVGPFQSALAGRPLVNLSLAVNYALGGLDPWGYHTWNLAVHLAAGLILFGLVRRTLVLPTFKGRFDRSAVPLAFVCALIWVVHPLQTEVINYVTQRTESMMGFCYFATLYAALRARTDPDHAQSWAAVAVAASAAGMACKESMATAPLMALLFAGVFLDNGLIAPLRRRPALYGALAATWIVVLALNWNAPRAHSAGLASGVTPWVYLQDQAVMLVRYLELTFWPHGLVIYYGLPGPIPLARAVPGGLVVVTLIGLIVTAWRRWPGISFLGIWVLVTLAPTTSVIPIATEVGAERRMYLALAAMVVGAVLGGWRLLSTAGERRPQFAVAAVSLTYVVLAGLTVQRNAEYQTPITLWQAALDRYPNGGAHYGLGMALREAGRHDEAMAEFRAATADYPEAEYALGVELDKAGHGQEAIGHYRAFIERRPTDFKVPATYRLMGAALADAGQFDEAEAAFRRSLEMQPGNSEAMRGLAEMFYQAGRYDAAAETYRQYLDRVPSDADAHNNRGLALVGAGHEPDAAAEFQRAATLRPSDVRFERNLGHALTSSGRYDDAVKAYRRALALAPDDALLFSSLGLALAAEGKADESRAAFQRALGLAPNDPQVGADIAEAMRLLGMR